MSEENKLSEIKLMQQILGRPYLIGISGGSGGGKTSVANILYKYLGKENCLLFSMDTYYKNLTPEQEKNLNNYNFDNPDALDLDLLSEHLTNLMNWKSIDMPTYDFSTNSRQKETIHLNPNKFIIFEGILAFHDKRIRDLMDLKLFIDLDDDIRLSRRIFRDILSRGRKMEDVIERYHKFVKPAYNHFIKPTKQYADIIIPRGGSNTVAIGLINYHLKYKLANIIKKLKNENEKVNYCNSEKNDCLINKEDIFCDKICVLEENEKDLYLSMFKNFLFGKKYNYFDLYLDIYNKKIYSIIQNKIFIFKKNEMKKIEEKIQKSKENNNNSLDVFIYVPILFDFPQKSLLLDYLKGINEIKNINIISVFLSKEIYEKYDGKNKIKIKSIYCGKIVDNNKKFIENGGYLEKLEGEYSNYLLSFSEDNFEDRLVQLIEINKK